MLLILISGIQLLMYYLLFKGQTENFMKRRKSRSTISRSTTSSAKYAITKWANRERRHHLGNKKAVELWEVHAGECHCDPLFNHNKLLKAIAQLPDNGHGVMYTEHFEKTDSYYDVSIHRGFDLDVVEIFCFNITKRKKAQDELKQTSNLLEMTLELAHVVPWRWRYSEKDVIMKYNDALRKINHNLKHTDEKDIAVSIDYIMSLVEPEARESLKDNLKALHEGSKQFMHMELHLLIPNAHDESTSDEWIEVNASVEQYDADNKGEILIGSFARITERIEQMRILVEAREAAKEADRLKSAFLANMSHEIRPSQRDRRVFRSSRPDGRRILERKIHQYHPQKQRHASADHQRHPGSVEDRSRNDGIQHDARQCERTHGQHRRVSAQQSGEQRGTDLLPRRADLPS